jgi:hypothetical protein
MANPIIKIKRGSGIPPVWNGSIGLTAGEFAFNKSGNVLYIGASGGYGPWTSGGLSGGLVGNHTLNNIPIGMQISNDPEFGAGGELNVRGGYSEFTVPTTKAVREFVYEVKAQQALGLTLNAGPGIGITAAYDGITTVNLTVSNTGLITGFDRIGWDSPLFNFGGSYIADNPGATYIKSISNNGSLTFVALGGIKTFFEAITPPNYRVGFQNIGVTGIAGYTGDITNITPIVSLPGFTVAIGRAVIDQLGVNAPIVLDEDPVNGTLSISHANLGAVGTYAGWDTSNAFPFATWNLTGDDYGHVTGFARRPLALLDNQLNSNFKHIIPGFTASTLTTVVSSSAAGIGGIIPTGEGIRGIQSGITYDSNNPSKFRIYNTGVHSVAGISGDITLNGTQGIAITPAAKNITITNTNPVFQTINVVSASTLANGSPKIPNGGIVGDGSNIVQAEAYNDTLRIAIGSGLGASAGTLSFNDDTITIWNTGITGIQARDGSNQNIGSAKTGRYIIQAGNNISISDITDGIQISSAGGGAAGIGSLRADFGVTFTSFDTEWSGNGVTGNIEFMGLNGLITKQSINPTAGVDGTNNGDLYVGLSSQLIVPKKTILSIPLGGVALSNGALDERAQLKLPTTVETRDSSDSYGGVSQGYQLDPLLDYTGNTPNYAASYWNFIKTDSIVGGVTGTITYIRPGTNEAYQPNLNAYTNNNGYILPGKSLVLTTPSGWINADTGPGQVGPVQMSANDYYYALTPNKQAEIRLLAFPSAENLGAELHRVRDVSLNPDPCTGPHGENGCKGWPPKLPYCSFNNTSEQFYTGNADTSALVMKGNIIAKDSLYVDKDIWLKGNLLDAESGCLISTGGAGGGAGSGYTSGDLHVRPNGNSSGSLYVYGPNAYLNVNTFAVKDNLIKIGGLSGGLPQDSSIDSDDGDRGVILFNKIPLISTPLNLSNTNGPVTPYASFVGTRRRTGRFTFIPNATVVTNAGVDEVTGTPGSAEFSDINGVHIINGAVSGANGFRLTSGVTGDQAAIRSMLAVQGGIHLIGVGVGNSLIAQDVVATTPRIRMLSNSSIILSNTGSYIAVGMGNNKGITFASGAGTYTNASESTSLSTCKFIWPASGSSEIRTASIRDPGNNSHTQIVDVGRYYTDPTTQNASLGSALGSPPANVSESFTQILWNKILGEGTIIDCGTY